MLKLLGLLLLVVALNLVYAQTPEKEKNKSGDQGVVANTIDAQKGEATNTTDVAVPDTLQESNNQKVKTPEQNVPKRKAKRRRRPRFRGRARRPRRKRPGKRKPTPKPKITEVATKEPKQSSAGQSAEPKANDQTQPGETKQKLFDTKTNQRQDVKTKQQMQETKEIQSKPDIKLDSKQEVKIVPEQKLPQANPKPEAKATIVLPQQALDRAEPNSQLNLDTSQNRPQTDNKQNSANNPKADQNPDIVNNPKVIDKPKPANKPKTETKPKPKDKPKTVKEPKKMDIPQSEESFFDFFAQETATEDPSLQAPPDFDPNQPPAEKVLPDVDPSKAVAYDGTPCAVNYKAHEKDPHKYMMRLPEDKWQEADCPPNRGEGLVWRQDLCNCGEELVPQDPNDICGLQGYNPYPNNRHKYMRRHHNINNVMDCPANLVWSQKECLCRYDPDAIRPIEPTVTFVCKTILNLTFEDHLQNTAEGYYVKPVKFGRRSKIPRIRFVKTLGADGLAAQIVSQPLQFQAFRGNDFQKQVTFSLNFKVSGRRRKSKNFMLLLTDECARRQSGVNKQWKPSISLSFQPSSRTFRLLFRTEKKVIEEDIKGAKPDNYGWYKVVVYFEDMTVNLENNGQKLFTAGDVQGKIPPNRCPLYIAGRGKGYNKIQNFFGFMDNVFLVKDCKFHESNIKIL